MKNTKLAGFAGMMAAVLLAGCAKGPESTVEAFHAAMAKGEISEAKTYLHPDVERQLGQQKLEAILTKEAQRLQKCDGIESMKTELSGEGEIRQGTITIDFKGDCPTRTQDVSLKQFEGKWLLGGAK